MFFGFLLKNILHFWLAVEMSKWHSIGSRTDVLTSHTNIVTSRQNQTLWHKKVETTALQLVVAIFLAFQPMKKGELHRLVAVHCDPAVRRLVVCTVVRVSRARLRRHSYQ
jgi:hypothetical protein